MFDPMRIVEWINERGFTDQNWMNGNCYFFAVILQEAWPGGMIVHDPVTGHFLYQYEGGLYDFRGYVGKIENYEYPLDSWGQYRYDEPRHWLSIMRDCIGGYWDVRLEKENN